MILFMYIASVSSVLFIATSCSPLSFFHFFALVNIHFFFSPFFSYRSFEIFFSFPFLSPGRFSLLPFLYFLLSIISYFRRSLCNSDCNNCSKELLVTSVVVTALKLWGNKEQMREVIQRFGEICR